MKLEDLEQLRDQIESWLRADGVPAEEVPEAAKKVIHRVWDNRGAYDPAKPLKPWLRTIAKRIAIDLHRTLTTRAALAYRLLEDEHSSWTPERQCIHEELLRSLSDAIATLDEESRALIEAHYMKGRSLREMSQDLGVPESTLNKRLIRARAAIREYLKERGITDAHRTVLPLVFFRALYTFGSDGNPEGEGPADSPSGPQAELPPAPPSPNPGPLRSRGAEPREDMAPGAEYGSLVNEELREDMAPGAEYGSLVNEEPGESTAPSANRPGTTVNEEPKRPRTPSTRPGQRWRVPDRPAILVAGVLIGLFLRASTCASAHHAELEVTLRAEGPVRLASLRATCGIAAAPTLPTTPPTPAAAPLGAAPRPASHAAPAEPTQADREATQELLSGGTVEPVAPLVTEPASLRTP